MKKVWKYHLRERDRCIDVPYGAVFRAVRLHPIDGAWLWFEVDPSANTEQREFRVFGTGHEIPDDAVYIATLFQDPFVWHLYEMEIGDAR